MAEHPIIQIRRYPNRRLWRGGKHQYVTHEDLVAFIIQGEDLQILDHVTGEDITTPTLLMVLSKDTYIRDRIFNSGDLHERIRACSR